MAGQLNFIPPYRDLFLNSDGFLSRQWEWFVRTLWERLDPLGVERSFTIENNKSAHTDIAGLSFSSKSVSQAIIEFLVQRVTTGSGAVEYVESGILIATYNPTSDDWNLVSVSANTPDNSGVDFFITSSGQVQYTSSNINTGTPSISSLFYRVRTLAGKNHQYSAVSKK